MIKASFAQELDVFQKALPPFARHFKEVGLIFARKCNGKKEYLDEEHLELLQSVEQNSPEKVKTMKYCAIPIEEPTKMLFIEDFFIFLQNEAYQEGQCTKSIEASYDKPFIVRHLFDDGNVMFWIEQEVSPTVPLHFPQQDTFKLLYDALPSLLKEADLNKVGYALNEEGEFVTCGVSREFGELIQMSFAIEDMYPHYVKCEIIPTQEF